jgi:hypothetical protein
VLPDGIAPGRDLIVVKASGQVIDDGGGGISAGMSGSPIYSPGGKLIGALSLGFAEGPSPIGGVTPADDMLELLGEPATASAPTPASVSLTTKLRSRIAAAEGTSTSSVPSTMTRLKVPLAVSGGMFPRHRDALAGIGSQADDPFIVTGGASARASLTPTATVAAGDSFAAALSYGDVTAGAIGTTTYVCNGRALAFGHPFLFAGPTVLGASRADIVTIVDDALEPYKLANITDPIGIVDLDRLQGLRGALGEPIPTIPITQTTTALDTGKVRAGETDAVDTPGSSGFVFPDLAAEHGIANIDATFNQISGGSSFLTFTVHGTRAGGAPFTFTRTNRWVSGDDISFLSMLELDQDLFELETNGFEEVDFTSVHTDVFVERTQRQYSFSRALWSRNGRRFRNLRRMQVNPGDRIRAQVVLRASDGAAAKMVILAFHVPRRHSGQIDVLGGGELLGLSGGGDSSGESLSAPKTAPVRNRAGIARWLAARAGSGGRGTGSGSGEPSSFDQFLADLRAFPRNDSLLGAAVFGKGGRLQSRLQSKVVFGEDTLDLKIVPRRHRAVRHPAAPR